MSIVGPRPHMIKHTEQYSEIMVKIYGSSACKPGITGAQIRGFRGETKEIEEMEGREGMFGILKIGALFRY